MRVALLFIVLLVQLWSSLSFLPSSCTLKLQRRTHAPHDRISHITTNNRLSLNLDINKREQDATAKSHNIYNRNTGTGTQWWVESFLKHRKSVETAILSFFVALAVRMFVLEPRYIPSLSMFPTFKVGDMLLVDKLSKWFKPFQRRDVVVFNPTETYQALTDSTDALIKRIVAIAGDVVSVTNNRLFVNGVVQEEGYVAEYPDYSLSETTVPAGMVLVLGDNRNHSFDSHIWGFLPVTDIIGRAVLKYWPLMRAGTIEGSH